VAATAVMALAQPSEWVKRSKKAGEMLSFGPDALTRHLSSPHV